MEKPPSHDLSEYRPIDLSDIKLGPDERRLLDEGWQCVRIYSPHHNAPAELARNDAQLIQEAGAHARITYYTENVEREPTGRGDELIINEERGGARVWMAPRLPEMGFGTPV